MWYTDFLTIYDKPLADVPAETLQQISHDLQRLQSPEPVVTVSVIAYNEERHVPACLWSLSRQQSRYPMEIIGINNDSRDQTAEAFRRCGIEPLLETQHSCGHARQCGLTHARGRYHINIDSDTLYPPHYVEHMVEALERDGVMGVTASWSYMPDAQHPRWQLAIYEACRDVYLWLQHFRRPELSVRGLVFAYRTEEARRHGIRTDIIRGEDGSLALQLKRHGKLVFLHGSSTRAVTGYGTVGADGTLMQSFMRRISMRLASIGTLFTRRDHYDDDPTNLVKQ